MIFTAEHAQMVVHQIKRQTRRPVKSGEWAEGIPGYPAEADEAITAVYGSTGRLKWQVGKDYAAQPGRGKDSIGRTPPVIEIRREMLQEMTVQDLREEMGTAKDDPRRWAIYLLPNFIKLWNSLYRVPERWEDNPEVWALVFQHWTDEERLAAASLDRIERREGLTYSNAERFSKRIYEVSDDRGDFE